MEFLKKVQERFTRLFKEAFRPAAAIAVVILGVFFTLLGGMTAILVVEGYTETRWQAVSRLEKEKANLTLANFALKGRVGDLKLQVSDLEDQVETLQAQYKVSEDKHVLRDGDEALIDYFYAGWGGAEERKLTLRGARAIANLKLKPFLSQGEQSVSGPELRRRARTMGCDLSLMDISMIRRGRHLLPSTMYEEEERIILFPWALVNSFPGEKVIPAVLPPDLDPKKEFSLGFETWSEKRDGYGQSYVLACRGN